MWEWNASPVFGKVQEDLKCKIPPSHGADYICTLSKSAKDKLYYFYAYCVSSRHNFKDLPGSGGGDEKMKKSMGFEGIELHF